MLAGAPVVVGGARCCSVVLGGARVVLAAARVVLAGAARVVLGWCSVVLVFCSRRFRREKREI